MNNEIASRLAETVKKNYVLTQRIAVLERNIQEISITRISTERIRLQNVIMEKKMVATEKKVLDMISDLTVMECVELTKDIEERFNVKASDVVQMLPVTEQTVVEEMIEELDVDVILISYGDKRVSVIKAVRSILGLQLKESLELVRSVPVQIGDSMAPIEAEELKRILEDAGGKVNIK